MKQLRAIKALVFCIFATNATGASLFDMYGATEPLGVDKQKKVFSTLFDIELWARSFPEKYDQDLTIRIKFASRFDNSDVIEFLSEEAQEIHDFSNAQLKDLKKSMSKGITCNPKAGTILDLNYIPRKGIQITCQGMQSSELIPDGPHSFYLLDVFLHPESEYENLSNS